MRRSETPADDDDDGDGDDGAVVGSARVARGMPRRRSRLAPRVHSSFVSHRRFPTPLRVLARISSSRRGGMRRPDRGGRPEDAMTFARQALSAAMTPLEIQPSGQGHGYVQEITGVSSLRGLVPTELSETRREGCPRRAPRRNRPVFAPPRLASSSRRFIFRSYFFKVSTLTKKSL